MHVKSLDYDLDQIVMLLGLKAELSGKPGYHLAHANTTLAPIDRLRRI